MKNTIKFVALIISLFFVGNIYALTETDVINRIMEAENKTKENVQILNTWSDNYKYDFKNSIKKEFIINMNSLSIEKNIDEITNKLKSQNYIEAANALNEKKQILIENSNYIKETMNILEQYLDTNEDKYVSAHLDLFIQIRQSSKNLKTPIYNLVKTYYDLYYVEMKNKILNTDNIQQLRNLYQELLDKIIDFDTITNTLQNKFSNYQDIYNEYHLEDFEDLFKDYFKDYYQKLNEDYKTLYENLETKMQTKLDQKIKKIVDETKTTDPISVNERNNKLIEIINYIIELEEEIENKFSQINSKIKIPTIINYANKYESEITTRLQQAENYTKGYLIDTFDIFVKNENDKTKIDIDKENSILIYKDTTLNETQFLNKLGINYGILKVQNTYNGNIGTYTKLQVDYNGTILKEFTVVVKGDIKADGKINISDVAKLANIYLKETSLNDIEMISADVKEDQKINISDVAKLANIYLNLN